MNDDGIMQPVQDIFRDGDVVRGTIGWIDHPEFVHGDDMHYFQVGDIHSKQSRTLGSSSFLANCVRSAVFGTNQFPGGTFDPRWISALSRRTEQSN